MKKILLMMVLLPLQNLAETEMVDGIAWTYSMSDGEVQLGTGLGSTYDGPTAVSSSVSGAITIPSMLGGRPVTRIGKFAFYGCNGITSVVIPSGVTSIGGEAFGKCTRLLSVVIPSSVMSIDYEAFYACSGLKTVTIPDGVTSIGNAAFSGCSGLMSVSISSSVTSVGWDAFRGTPFYDNLPNGLIVFGGVLYECKGACPSSVDIPVGVKSIGTEVFYGCRELTSVRIPSSVMYIEEKAFSGCRGLTKVEIPSNVISIGDSAFYDCNGLVEVTISEGVLSIGEQAFCKCSGLTSVSIPWGVTNIGALAFSNCSRLTEVTIPASLTSIGESAFIGCSGLADSDGFLIVRGTLHDYFGTAALVTVPSRVTHIGEWAFSGAEEMISVTIKAGVVSIGDCAFAACTGLKTITIPAGVKHVGESAFQSCNALTSVTIPTSVTSIGNSAFSGCGGLCVVNVGRGDTERIKSLYAWSDKVEFVEVDLPLDEKVWEDGDPVEEVIGSVTWYGTYREGGVIEVCSCSQNFGELAIPAMLGGMPVTSIGSRTFYGCKNLKSISIPAGVTEIGEYAFSGCGGLTSVTIPESVTNIGSFAFSGCSGLASVTIPVCVKKLEDYVFRDCSGLTSVTIPPSVTSIGMNAFQGCSGLSSVEISEGVTNIGGGAFSDCSGLESITIPLGMKRIGQYAFQGCSGLTSVAIPEDVTNIWAYAFSGCTGLKSVTMPAGVMSIGGGAFRGCSALASVVIPEGVTTIGEYAFTGCSGLKSVTLPSSMAYIGVDAFNTGGGIEKVVVPDLAAFASIRFSNSKANPRNSAEALYVGDECRTEMYTVCYSLGEHDNYNWYASFRVYDENWIVSRDGLTISCDVPIGSTVCFNELGATIEEWGDQSFDGWEDESTCVVSDTEIIAKWRVKTLEEILTMLGGGSLCAWGEMQHFFLDANSACYRSQGILRVDTNPWPDEYYGSSSYVMDWLKQSGQLSVLMVGYDENYQEVAHARLPVIAFPNQDVWAGELFETNRVRYIAFRLAHSYYGGTYELYNPVNCNSIWEDVKNVGVRSPNLHYIGLQDSGYLLSGVKSGDVLIVSCNDWYDGDYFATSMDDGLVYMRRNINGEVLVTGVASFSWIVPHSAAEDARSHRTITFATSIGKRNAFGKYTWQYPTYVVDIDPDIITHRVFLCYGHQCDESLTNQTLTEQIVDDGLLPEFPCVHPLPGWNFVGWSPDSTRPVTNDIEYVAQYEPISYSITFENVKECENTNTNAYTVEDDVVFSALPDLPDWHFDGWSPAKIDVGTTGDVTVTALWRPIEKAEIVGAWSEPQTFEYDGQSHGVDYSARLDVMDWPLNVVTQGTIRAVNVGEYAATARAETVGVPETDTVYYRCAAVTNDCRWTITPKPVTKLQITYVSTAMIANGQPQTPQIVVRDVERGVVLTEDDYTLAYENNVEPGRGVARITGKGNYGGEAMIEFPIVASVSPSEGLNMDDGTFEIVGETDWVADNVETHDGYAAMRSGAIGDGEESALTSVVHGAGTVSFWWKISSQRFDSVLELDRLEFYIDGERQKWINGDTSWAKLSYKIEGAGPHEFRWVYVKDGSVSERQDCGWVDEVTWEKDWLIGDWLNDVDREFTTDEGDSLVTWVPDSSVSADGVGSMRSGACQQGERSVLSTVVENAGELTFKWKSSCVAYGDYVTDKLSLLVDGVPVKDKDGKDIFVNGQTDWRDVSCRISGAGRHEVQWVFEKVSDASMGQNCGWVDVVRWNGEPGTLTESDLAVESFDGVYDGQTHGAVVSVPGAQNATVKYGTCRDAIGNAASPTFADCGEHEVWFAVNVPEFNEYVGKAVVRIQPRSIETGAVTLGAPLVYTGAVQTQDVASVVVDGLVATFKVSDNDVREAGEWQLTVAGTGNFCGEKSVPFVVARAAASLDDVTVEDFSAEADAVEFTYDGKAHQPKVVAAYDPSATMRFALSEDGPYADELGVSNAVERLDVWYEITSANFKRLVGQTRMTIHPLSIEGAEVVLGEQVSDVEGHVVQQVDSVIVDGLAATFDVANNVAAAEGDFELTVFGTGNFTDEAKCPYSVGGIVLPPVMTPGDGAIITNALTVYITAQTPESKCYYTLDGSMPTTNSLTARRVNLHEKTTIRAMSVLDGKLRSAVVEARYALGACENPKIRLDGQDGRVFHFPEQLVVIDWKGEEGVVRYTVDGSEPTVESPAYEGPFAISETTTVKAKAFSDAYFDSETVTAEMRLDVLSVPSPVIVAKGEYVGTKTTVSMSCALVGAVVRYTLDGSDPTAASALYEGPFEIGGALGSSLSVKARAFCGHYEDSPVAEAVVTRVWGVGDTLGVPDLAFTTDGWVVDSQETLDGRESMRSGPTGDGETKTLETVVQGGGTISFSWRTSCEDSDGDFIWDRAEFWVDDECVAKLEGESGWLSVVHEIPDDKSDHRLRWLYVKDPEPDSAEGEDCAWLNGVRWLPCGASLARPSVDDDPDATVTGDAENGFVVKPSEGKTSVEVSIPQGVDAAKVTVEVSTKVASVKPNGAKVKIVSGEVDITEYLVIPGTVGCDGGGAVATQEDAVIDLTKATVKEEIVKEAMDVEKGAVVELLGGSQGTANPTITTAPTRVGLVYTFSEGRTLGGMERSASKPGDGKPWSPEIKVKGGNSAFYSIGVGKGE